MQMFLLLSQSEWTSQPKPIRTLDRLREDKREIVNITFAVQLPSNKLTVNWQVAYDGEEYLPIIWFCIPKIKPQFIVKRLASIYYALFKIYFVDHKSSQI